MEKLIRVWWFWEKMKGKKTIWWLVQNIGSKFFLTVFGFRDLITASKKPVKLIRCQKWSGHYMYKETDQALYSSFFSKQQILGGWEKMEDKTTICWLVQNMGSKFFLTVFFDSGRLQEVREAHHVQTNRSSALLFNFFQKPYFGGFWRVGRKWREKQQYVGWSRILVLNSSRPFFGVREASNKSVKLIRCQK